jgi:outer membrane protein OmpA-like peptidoglycan-associated protein
MNEQNDDAQNFALMAVAAVVALVIAGVLALAISTTMGGARGAAANTAVAATAGPAMPASGSSVTQADAAAAVPNFGPADGRIYFELASDALPADAQADLARIADAARADPGKVVLISGFHDESGDASKNAELAKNRAVAVRHALEANGVARERLVMDKPRVTLGGADAREARRVEMRLR